MSQSIVGHKKTNYCPDYESQLTRFPVLNKIVTKMIGIIQAEQEKFVKDAKVHEIGIDNVSLSHKMDEEFTASIIE